MARKKKEIVVAKDFGDIQVPTSWNEITLKKFVELMRLQDNLEEGEEPSVIDIMSVLIGKEKKFIYSLPSEFANTIMAHMLFLNEPLDDTPKHEVVVDGEKYSINYMEKLKFGEYTDANMALQNDPYNYSGLLAILCRKDGEVYDDDYIADNLEDRIEMWENQPISTVYPIVCFFLALHATSETHLRDSLTELEQTIDRQLTSIEDSVKNGDGKKHSILWRMRMRRKLKKLRKNMSQQS